MFLIPPYSYPSKCLLLLEVAKKTNKQTKKEKTALKEYNNIFQQNFCLTMLAIQSPLSLFTLK